MLHSWLPKVDAAFGSKAEGSPLTCLLAPPTLSMPLFAHSCPLVIQPRGKPLSAAYPCTPSPAHLCSDCCGALHVRSKTLSKPEELNLHFCPC